MINSRPRLNPIVVQNFLEVIQPFFKFCIKYPKTFARLYNFYFVLVVLSSFKLLSLSFIKFIFSILLSSLGILWSETLSSISGLKFIAEIIVDYSNSIIKSIGKALGVDNVRDFNSDWIPLIASVVLGLTGIVIIAMIGDHYASDSVRTVPYLGGILDSFYSFINPIIEWFTGNKPLIDHEPVEPNRIFLPQPISRSSSSSSSSSSSNGSSSLGSSTVTQGSNILTPPSSRASTPIPDLPEDYSDVIRGGVGVKLKHEAENEYYN